MDVRPPWCPCLGLKRGGQCYFMRFIYHSINLIDFTNKEIAPIISVATRSGAMEVPGSAEFGTSSAARVRPAMTGRPGFRTDGRAAGRSGANPLERRGGFGKGWRESSPPFSGCRPLDTDRIERRRGEDRNRIVRRPFGAACGIPKTNSTAKEMKHAVEKCS